MTCAALSLAGFALRGLLMVANSAILGRRWVRTVPHINDTILLAAAIGLAMQSGQYPWTTAWLAAKIAGLFAYIGLGVLALRPGSSKPLRIVAWIMAMVCFLWIVSVARLRNPMGFLALM
ncbi:MAG: SirB2 family protein [Rhodocyclaceae bacterium]|nr:SirB2 family protein [Rhodocyclaceae bacterium]